MEFTILEIMQTVSNVMPGLKGAHETTEYSELSFASLNLKLNIILNSYLKITPNTISHGKEKKYNAKFGVIVQTQVTFFILRF